MPTPETVARFIARVESNAHVEAIEEFYAEDGRIRENGAPPRVGRAELAARERAVLARARSVESTCVRPVLISGSTVVIRWIFSFEWLDGSSTRIEELAWQQWDGERIREEQFFYDPAETVPRPPAWEARIAALWAQLDEREPAAFIAELDALTSELQLGRAVALFERGAAHDSTGSPELAVPLYRAALAAGLGGLRRRRATIQLASSLRNLGQADEAVELLTKELAAPSDELDGAVRAFLGLALASLGRERDALALALTALSRTLPRYNRSLARYAGDLLPPGEPANKPANEP